MPISTVGGVPEKYLNRLVHSVLSCKSGGGPPINLHERLVHSVPSCKKSGHFYNLMYKIQIYFQKVADMLHS